MKKIHIAYLAALTFISAGSMIQSAQDDSFLHRVMNSDKTVKVCNATQEKQEIATGQGTRSINRKSSALIAPGPVTWQGKNYSFDPNQTVELHEKDGEHDVIVTDHDPGEWNGFEYELPNGENQDAAPFLQHIRNKKQ